MSIVICSNCGAKNRVEERAGMQAVCGRCGQALSATGGNVIVVTDATFGDVVHADQPVLIDCWAPWCGPCRMLAPTIERIASKAHGRWVIGKLNTDENPGVAQQFQISSIPTLLIFQNGRLVDRLVGLQPENAIVARLESFLGVGA